DKFAGYVELKTGRYSRADARGALSMPLIAGVLDAKIALSTRNADGFGRRPLAGDIMGDQHTSVGVLQLNWTPREGLNGLFSFDYTKTDQKLGVHHVELYTGSGLGALQNVLAGPLAALHPGVVMQPLDNSTWYSPDPYVDNGTGSNYLKTEVWGVSQSFDWTIGKTVLKSITAYRRLHELIGIDPDGSPVVMIDEIDNDHQSQLSQELQLSGVSFRDRLKWVSGLYYMNEKSSSDVIEQVANDLFPALEALPAAILPLGPYPCPQPPGSPAPCLGGAGNPFNIIFDLPQHGRLNQLTESYAAYAQGSYKLTDALSLTLGGRYTSDRKYFGVSSLRLRSPIPLLPYTTQSGSWAKFSGRAGLDYRLTDSVLAYVSASQGFKSGGFNGRARNVGELEGYGPETLLSYELGLKSEWFDHHLRANFAAFTNKYKDIQLTEQHLSPEGTQTIVTHNAGDADIKGFEFELDAVPVKGLRLNASVGYLDAKYVRISAAAAATGLTLSDRLIGTPRWTVTGGAEYGFPLGQYGQLTLRGDASYRALTYFQLINEPTTPQPGYSLFNARLGFESSDGHWTAATGVTNLANKVYRVSGVNVGDSLGFTVGWYGRPREWYLQGGYRF
ncbi:MAG: TonB-dependent receptor, partial [Gammaproteobacteria bacterium]|nr:TonB-dependent receptor [Gammaproteobacteria bacterium]